VNNISGKTFALQIVKGFCSSETFYIQNVAVIVAYMSIFLNMQDQSSLVIIYFLSKSIIYF